MTGTDAYLEIGLRWREGSAFDVTLEYDDPDDSGDRREFNDQPITIDCDELGRLEFDEQAYAECLTRSVLGSQRIATFYANARTVMADSELAVHVRLFIDINAPPRYHGLRWELLLDGPGGKPLALARDVYVSRFLSARDWRQVVPPPKHELKALVVVANPPDLEERWRGLPTGRSAAIDVEAELDRARHALRDIATTEVGGDQPASLRAIAQAIEDVKPDVLYLVCHGASKDGKPLLVLQDDDGGMEVVDGSDVISMVDQLRYRPTLAVLCSCASAGTAELSTADGGALSALGPGIAAAGVAAVVAMQGDITMETAAVFLPCLFEELASHGVIDRAVAAARRMVRDRGDWWSPVLFSRLKRGRTYYNPEFGVVSAERWRTLTGTIEDERCTPVLGPGLADDILVPRHVIARAWADLWQMPIPEDRRDDLVAVAQYLQVRIATLQPADELTRYMVRAFRERYATRLPPEQLMTKDADELARAIGAWCRERDPDDPYKKVAALDLPVYITTSWTGLLEDALTAAGKRPRTGRFEWFQDRVERDRDRVVPTKDEPLVYHLFGTLDEPESLVLSEDDYFTWLAAWSRWRNDLLPSVVAKALTRRSLMFIGYRLDDWDFRVLFHSIKNFGGAEKMKDRPHVGVQLNPYTAVIEPESAQDYLERYFGKTNVNIFWGSTRRFLVQLDQRMAAVGVGATGR